MLNSAVDGGDFCYPQMTADPWLDPIRGDVEFKRILHRAEARYQEAVEVFRTYSADRLGDDVLAVIDSLKLNRLSW